MFRCAICNERIKSGLEDSVGLQCKNCGGRVFYKERPNVRKKLKAR